MRDDSRRAVAHSFDLSVVFCRKLPRDVVGEQTLCVEQGSQHARLDETDVAFFARWGVGGEVFGMADHTKADAFDVGVDAPPGEESFPLGTVEHLVGAVNPARAPTEGVGGVEQIAHHERTVVEIGGLGAIGQDDHGNGSTVERISVATEDFGVEAREFVAHRAVGDDNDEWRLAAASRGGVGAGIGNTLQVGERGEQIGRKTLDAAPSE